MATIKNTADLQAQAAADQPDNTTQLISPQDVREMSENLAVSNYNKLTDAPLVGLKEFNVIPTYESGQGAISGGKIYISNKVTGPGAFVPADWDLYDELSAADKAKLDFITVTGAVDLDDVKTKVDGLDQAVVLKGTWDPSTGTFPGGGTAQAGWSYICAGTTGTVDGQEFTVDQDRIICILDNASTSTYSGNWYKSDGSDKVLSVNGQAGTVVITKTDVGLSNVPNTDFTTAVGLNTAKVTNVTTDLAEGATTNTTVLITSSDGTDATLQAASTTRAGVLSKEKFDEIVANTAKTTNANHSGDATGATALTLQPGAITGKGAAAALTGAETVLLEQSGGLVQSTTQDIADLGGGDNLGNADLTLTGARVVTMGANTLSFEGNTTIFKGIGATSGTTTLLTKNGSGTNSFKIDDAGNLFSGIGNFALAEFSGYITTRGTVATHLSSNVHTFRASGSTADRGIAVFTSLSGVVGLSVGTSGVGVQTDAQTGVSLKVKANAATAQSKTWLGVNTSNSVRSAITVDGKLGLGQWGTDRLTTSFVASAGFVNVPASTTAEPQLYLEAGVDPTAPNNGAIWFDGTDLKMHVGGVTKTFTLV